MAEPVADFSRAGLVPTDTKSIAPVGPNHFQRFNRKVRDFLLWCPPDPLDGFNRPIRWPWSSMFIPLVGQSLLFAYLVLSTFVLIGAAGLGIKEGFAYLCARVGPWLFGPEP